MSLVGAGTRVLHMLLDFKSNLTHPIPIRRLFIFFALILLAACTPNNATPTSDIPRLLSEETLPPPTITPLQLLTATPTEIAVGARTPSLTPIRVSPTTSLLVTVTPPDTLTPTITATPTATLTLTRTRTATPSLTPTASITPTPSITLTPSRTPAITLTPEGTCPYTWFFTPAPTTCPLTNTVTTAAAYQPMQNGLMIWTQSGLSIFVLFTDTLSPAWIVAPDMFREGEPEVDFNLQIPTGLLQPRRGFGKLWRGDSALQERLGWGTSAELGYTASIQSDAVTGIRYISAPNGEIYALAPDQLRWWRER